MVINVNLTPQEIQSLYQVSAVTGLSVDEIIHDALIKIIEASNSPNPETMKSCQTLKNKVYPENVDPYAPVFEETDWEMLTDSSSLS
ncbi:MAG: hypothetical protein AB4058_07275 [Microcystaceae cyanobacterium]